MRIAQATLRGCSHALSVVALAAALAACAAVQPAPIRAASPAPEGAAVLVRLRPARDVALVRLGVGRADTVVMRDASEVAGRVVGWRGDTLRIRVSSVRVAHDATRETGRSHAAELAVGPSDRVSVLSRHADALDTAGALWFPAMVGVAIGALLWYSWRNRGN